MPQKYYVLCESNGARRYFCGYRNVAGGWHVSGDERDALAVVLHKADRIAELHRKSYPCSHVQVLEVRTAKQKESNKVEKLTAERDRLRAERDAILSMFKKHGFSCYGDDPVDASKQVVQVAVMEADNSKKSIEQLTAANDTIAGLREALIALRKEISAGCHSDAPVEELKDGINFEVVSMADAALDRTSDQHRKAIEAGVLRRIDEQIARERDSYILAFGSLDAEDVLKIIRAEAERLEKEAGNGIHR